MTRTAQAAVLAFALGLSLGLGAESTAIAQQPTFDPGDGRGAMRIFGTVGGDWDQDDLAEFAMLAAPASDGGVDATLFIYRSTMDGWSAVVVVDAIAWAGAFAGTTPFLRPGPADGFQIVSENMSVGRNRWRQAITVVHRDGAYIVAGYTYDAYDTLDPDAARSCDVNFLTGRAEVDGVIRRAGSRDRPLRLSEWSAYSERPEICGAL